MKLSWLVFVAEKAVGRGGWGGKERERECERVKRGCKLLCYILLTINNLSSHFVHRTA